MECEIFRVLLKHVSDHLYVIFSLCMTAPITNDVPRVSYLQTACLKESVLSFDHRLG